MPIYSVLQFNSYVKNIFRMEELLRNISIKGEVGDWSVSADNAYFVLKDAEAQVNCVCFEADAQDYLPKTGDKVIVTGSPAYYVKGGRLNFNVSKIEPCGEGELYKQFLILKNKLLKEGLFDRKSAMPDNIRRIGVVTSPTGAVINDIINVAKRRSPYIDIVVFPVKVQGIGSELDIVEGIKFFDGYSRVDAVVVARGGGALEDLNAYNTEAVARAVADCGKFLVSAVGHETDYTLCDFAADLRAPTPSAAAELLTSDIAAEKEGVKQISLRLKELVNIKYNAARDRFGRSLLELENRIISLTQRAGTGVIRAQADLNMSMFFDRREAAVVRMQDKLAGLNPLRLAEQGYARITKEGQYLDSVKDLSVNDKIKIYFQDGHASAEIQSKG